MKVLAVAPHVPHEAIKHAGGAYLLHHLGELDRRGHEVTLLAPGTPTQLAAADLAPAWLDVVTGPDVRRPRSTPRVVLDAGYRRLMTAPPAPTAESLRSVHAAGLVDRARGADVVELHWAEYARFATVLRRAGVRTPICVVEHDVDLRAGAYRTSTHARGYRRWLGQVGGPLAQEVERRGLREADLVAVFKAADADLVRSAGISTPVQVIDPWLDPPGDLSGPRDPALVLFVGALWRRENEDGLVRFLERAWPHVADRRPDARLQLVGAGATQRLLDAAAAAHSTEVIGPVEDLMPYYRRAGVFVAPLVAAGGLKFKVPQAMLCALPVVATAVAVEGVVEAAPSGTLWGVGDDVHDLADHVVSALDDPTAAAAVGRAAADWAASNYSFARSIDRLEERYDELLAAARS